MTSAERSAFYRDIFLPLAKAEATRRGIPAGVFVEMVRRESNFDPNARGLPSTATGLGQILDGTRRLYNGSNEGQQNPVRSQGDLTDPATNLRVMGWLLKTIADVYFAQTTVELFNYRWDKPQYVALIVLGYTAGWSEFRGVGAMLKELESQGVLAPTYEQVIEYAMRSQPDTKIYNDGRGYMSDPKLAMHVARVVRGVFPQLADGVVPSNIDLATRRENFKSLDTLGGCGALVLAIVAPLATIAALAIRALT